MSFPNKHRKQRRNLYRSWRAMGLDHGAQPVFVVYVKTPLETRVIERVIRVWSARIAGAAGAKRAP